VKFGWLPASLALLLSATAGAYLFMPQLLTAALHTVVEEQGARLISVSVERGIPINISDARLSSDGVNVVVRRITYDPVSGQLDVADALFEKGAGAESPLTWQALAVLVEKSAAILPRKLTVRSARVCLSSCMVVDASVSNGTDGVLFEDSGVEPIDIP